MGTDSSTLNLTGVINDTYFDMFCTDLTAGPLISNVLNLLLASVGISACVWLLWVLFQRQHRTLNSHIYTVNLTIMDLFFNVFIIPDVLNFFFWHDQILITAVSFTMCFNSCGRPLFMACICVDCYMAVVHPITYMRMKDRRYRLVLSALVWVFTLAYGFQMILFFQKLLIVMPTAFSAPIVAFCDLSVLYALRKPDPSGRRKVHPQKRRAIQTIIHSLVIALVSFLPQLIMFGFMVFTNLSYQKIACNILYPLYIGAIFGSTIMPLLYLGNLGCLKDIRMFRCCKN